MKETQTQSETQDVTTTERNVKLLKYKTILKN